MKYSILYRFAAFYYKNSPQQRSHFYRYQSWLKKKCSEIPAIHLLENNSDLALAQDLSRFAPLESADMNSRDMAHKLKEWNQSLPNDRLFYKMLMDQWLMWESFATKTLEFFFNSKEGKEWFRKRKTLTDRPPRFELDIPFKRSKAAALAHERKVKDLLRENPLLRYQDLGALKVKNAQPICERFPHQAYHREFFLKQIANDFALSR
jgi:hypothetical protein